EDLKKELAEKNVSANSITTIEKALKKGMVFKSPADLGLLNITPLDIGAVKDSVNFGTTIVEVPNIKTVAYSFKPVGPQNFFFGYQFVVLSRDKQGFSSEQVYPIEDNLLVIVDCNLNDLQDRSNISLRVKSAQGN